MKWMITFFIGVMLLTPPAFAQDTVAKLKLVRHAFTTYESVDWDKMIVSWNEPSHDTHDIVRDANNQVRAVVHSYAKKTDLALLKTEYDQWLLVEMVEGTMAKGEQILLLLPR